MSNLGVGPGDRFIILIFKPNGNVEHRTSQGGLKPTDVAYCERFFKRWTDHAMALLDPAIRKFITPFKQAPRQEDSGER